MSVKREGELEGLAAMIADLIEGNLAAHPERESLLDGPPRRVSIVASDIDAHVGMVLGGGNAVIGGRRIEGADMEIITDSETLIDLPRAKLLGGLPSIADPIGRTVTKKLLSGKLKIKGIVHIGLLTRVQKLLSVS